MSGTSSTPIYDELRREQFKAAMRESLNRNRTAIEDLMHAARSAVLSGTQLFGLQIGQDRRVVLNGARANALILSTIPEYKPTALFNPTRPFSMQGVEPYMTVVDELLDAANREQRALSQTNKHYPTSTPSWARRSRR